MKNETIESSIENYARRTYQKIGSTDENPGQEADACAECGRCEKYCL